jgi:hypothetical protein
MCIYGLFSWFWREELIFEVCQGILDITFTTTAVFPLISAVILLIGQQSWTILCLLHKNLNLYHRQEL